MANNAWQEQENNPSVDPIGSLLDEWSDPEEAEEEFRSDFFQGLGGRRKKAAFVMMVICVLAYILNHFAWGQMVVIVATILFFLQALQIFLAKPEPVPAALTDEQFIQNPQALPKVSLIAAAKNEEAVIGRLVKNLCQLEYPQGQYDVWIIDDASTDKTPGILDDLAQVYSQLKIVHRQPNEGGGKSGALNQVLSQLEGEIIAVFDADAVVTPDLLRYAVPLFDDPKMGAVQVRKAIANGSLNFWTKGQASEMQLDSYFQQQRIAIGGIGELRGNGQFVRTSALNRCGAWNEQTITDDLDLTIRLHLDDWKIGFLLTPAVEEEGVTNVVSLWHQRSRWAEGGYQRYLDYWRYLIQQPLGLKKKLDLCSFMWMQYLLPTAAVPDFIFAIAHHHAPVLVPMTAFALTLSSWGVIQGSIRTTRDQPWTFNKGLNIAIAGIRGLVYMGHWLVIMPATTIRMAIRPKRLKWVKTVHQGVEENLASSV